MSEPDITIARPRKTVTLCTALDLHAQWERAQDALERARQASGESTYAGTNPAERAAAEEVSSLEDRMREHTLVFTIEAMPRKSWAEYEAKHPPRPDVDVDKTYGINISTLDDAIGPSVVEVTNADGSPRAWSSEKWPVLAEQLSNSQWEPFAKGVLEVNRGVSRAPFSRVASRIQRSSRS